MPGASKGTGVARAWTSNKAEATVLVDTTGWATGIAVSENGTSVYFGDEQGSLWSVTPTGAQLTQIATADGAWSL